MRVWSTVELPHSVHAALTSLCWVCFFVGVPGFAADNECAWRPCDSMLGATGECSPVGSTAYSCSCTDGYSWNATAVACKDIDGCSGQPCQGLADSTGVCTDVAASGSDYLCGCVEGFDWRPATKSCVAASACSLKPCAAVSNGTGVCLVTESNLGFKCVCQTGFQWDRVRAAAAGQLCSWR